MNEEEFSHRGAEAPRWTENQIGTIIVDCAAHKKQLLTYWKLTGLKLSYLLNLGEALMKDGITRIINGHL
ncbi:MAG: GxxExxY protein [Spirochaetales bacterium]|nr:GxxExxY protein [Spirochaetales bacterium]